MKHAKTLVFSALAGSLLTLSGCQSLGGGNAHQGVPISDFHGTPLDRYEIGVEERREYLEVQLDSRDTQLRVSEVMKVRAFLDKYADVGHGPLVISMPKKAEAPQLAVGAVSEIREFAWEAGIEYEQMLGAAYDASGRTATPVVMAFKTYEAIAPECPSLAEIDISNAVSNSEMATFGCAVRANMAAMIAEPADLLGGRELTEGFAARQQFQLDLWLQGQPTPSTRGDGESTAISTAVN
ncbi:MAG: CpaD family pilus assembly lipoprotein [Pseudomonadota bacterium]